MGIFAAQETFYFLFPVQVVQWQDVNVEHTVCYSISIINLHKPNMGGFMQDVSMRSFKNEKKKDFLICLFFLTLDEAKLILKQRSRGPQRIRRANF